MSQWAEIRHQHLVEGVAKKQIARRLQLDIKTVRRAVEQPTPPVRASSPRVRSLDPWREQIAQWLDQDRRLTAKRIRRRLLPLAGPVAARTVRRYVAAVKVATAPKEGYVHRSVRPGKTMEVDVGESWAEVAGVPRKVKYLVATLPYSNVYFAKAVESWAAMFPRAQWCCTVLGTCRSSGRILPPPGEAPGGTRGPRTCMRP